MANNAVATNTSQKPTVLSELKRCESYIAESLPVHVTPERFTRLALTTLRRTPKLQQTDPASFVGALYTAAALGLEPDVNGEAYLVPYGRETQLIVGYQGLAKLFWQHPLAARLSAEYVCENDEFDYDKGLAPRLHHRPALGDRGKVIAYYAIVGLKNGAVWFDVYSPETIKALRGGKVGPDPRFKGGDPEHWMERKTALRQVIKLAPKSVQLHTAVQMDESSIPSVEHARASLAPALEASPAAEAPASPASPSDVYEAELVPPDAAPDAWSVDRETGEVR